MDPIVGGPNNNCLRSQTESYSPQVVSLLQEGGQLSQPSHCPPPVYSLMTWCWQRRPQDRPSFPAIHTALLDLRAGRIPNIPPLPTPSAYTPAQQQLSPQHHMFHPPTGGGASTTTGPHSCLASMRAGSRGSFCSTDILTTRPCSCIPPPYHHHHHPVTTNSSSCHTLPRNTSAHHPHLSSPKHHTPLPAPQTLPRASQPPLQAHPRLPSQEELKKVPEETLSSTTGDSLMSHPLGGSDSPPMDSPGPHVSSEDTLKSAPSAWGGTQSQLKAFQIKMWLFFLLLYI